MIDSLFAQFEEINAKAFSAKTGLNPFQIGALFGRAVDKLREKQVSEHNPPRAPDALFQ